MLVAHGERERLWLLMAMMFYQGRMGMVLEE